MGPPESLTQTASLSHQKFLHGSLGDSPTDRPTDHATRSLTIGGIYVRSTVIWYNNRNARLFLIGGFLGPPESSTQTASRSLHPFCRAPH